MGSRVVLDAELDGLGYLGPPDLGDHRQGNVDAGRHPAPVTIRPCLTTRCSVGTPYPASSGYDRQCVVAGNPSSSPAAPSTRAPVYTEVVRVVRSWTSSTQSTIAWRSAATFR